MMTGIGAWRAFTSAARKSAPSSKASSKPRPLRRLIQSLNPMKEPQQILDQLKQPLDATRVKKRQGAGSKSLSYLETHDVIAHLNTVFGFDGWSDFVMEFTQQPADKGALFRAVVCIEAKFGADRFVKKTGVGVGVARSNSVEELEKAQKEAESDALKRAARKFGEQFGNSLYEKDAPEHQGQQRARLATQPQLTECETLRGQAVKLGFLLPNGNAPKQQLDGAEEKPVLGRIAAYRAYVQKHGDKGESPVVEPPTVDRWAAISAKAQGFKAYLDFIAAAQSRGFKWASDADIVEFENAATAKTGFPIVAEELGENDWAEWAAMVAGEEVRWGA